MIYDLQISHHHYKRTLNVDIFLYLFIKNILTDQNERVSELGMKYMLRFAKLQLLRWLIIDSQIDNFLQTCSCLDAVIVKICLQELFFSMIHMRQAF